MAKDLPYLVSNKNVEALFKAVQAAKRPETFTTDFLGSTLGLKSSTDRSFVPLLRTLGFLDGTNRPTAEYDRLKNGATRAGAIGDAIRRAYAALFNANEQAHELKSDQLKGLVAQVAGTDENNTNKIAYTFIALAKLADFGQEPRSESTTSGQEQEPDAGVAMPPTKTLAPMRADFHYNIQIHLPSGASEETYRNIFVALRETFR